jgi:hypothetical protein
MAAGPAVMDWIVVALKLLGATVAVRSVITRPPTAVRTVPAFPMPSAPPAAHLALSSRPDTRLRADTLDS